MTQALAVFAMVTDAFGGRGGIAQYNRDFLSALSNAGYEGAAPFTTVLPRYAPDPVALPNGVQQMGPKAGRIGYALNALKAALTRRIDVVFCGHLFMAPLALLIARLKGASLIVQTHGIEAWQPPSRLQRAATERADLVLSVSRYTRARVLGWAAMTPERVLVVPNTIRDVFTPGDGETLRAALGLEDKRVLLTVGRMDQREQYKGQDLVIDAIPELVSQGHDVAYVIVGDGDDRARLETLARDADVSERVHFLGSVEPPCLIEAYRMADLFAMPSKGEGFGIAFVEAMACGTPAVGLAVAGARDALAGSALGHAVSETDFTATLSRLLEQRKTRSKSDDPIAIRNRFGRETMRQGACAALNRATHTAAEMESRVFVQS